MHRSSVISPKAGHHGIAAIGRRDDMLRASLIIHAGFLAGLVGAVTLLT